MKFSNFALFVFASLAVVTVSAAPAKPVEAGTPAAAAAAGQEKKAAAQEKKGAAELRLSGATQATQLYTIQSRELKDNAEQADKVVQKRGINPDAAFMENGEEIQKRSTYRGSEALKAGTAQHDIQKRYAPRAAGLNEGFVQQLHNDIQKRSTYGSTFLKEEAAKEIQKRTVPASREAKLQEKQLKSATGEEIQKRTAPAGSTFLKEEAAKEIQKRTVPASREAKLQEKQLKSASSVPMERRTPSPKVVREDKALEAQQRGASVST
jgi:hypothetical protein